jgi:hypothetical protein
MTGAAVGFDPLAPGFAADPYPQYAALRDADPVHHSEPRARSCSWTTRTMPGSGR